MYKIESIIPIPNEIRYKLRIRIGKKIILVDKTMPDSNAINI